MPSSGFDIPAALAAQTLAAPQTAGSASGAALTAPFLTLATDSNLTAERVFTPGVTLTGIDNGAGNTYALGVNQGYAFTWTSLHNFNAGLNVAAGQSIQFASDTSISRKSAGVLQPGSGNSWESPTYSGSTVGWHIDAGGNAEFNNITARGEFRASTFVIQEIHAIGGSMVVLPAAELYAQVTTQ